MCLCGPLCTCTLVYHLCSRVAPLFTLFLILLVLFFFFLKKKGCLSVYEHFSSMLAFCMCVCDFFCMLHFSQTKAPCLSPFLFSKERCHFKSPVIKECIFAAWASWNWKNNYSGGDHLTRSETWIKDSCMCCFKYCCGQHC
jgi:hypothetical protein